MIRKRTRDWGSLLVLALAVLCWPPVLVAQSRVEIREHQQQEIQSLIEEQAARKAELEALRTHAQARLARLSGERLQEIQDRTAQVELELQKATEQRLREIQERQARAQAEIQSLSQERLQELQERAARAAFEREMEARKLTREERLRSEMAFQRARESAAREGLRSETARERALRQAERAQQVVVMARSRGRLGVSLDARQGRGYDAQGARVQGVSDGSPADEAGLHEGDIITHLDGHSLLEPLEKDMEGELDEYASLPVQRLIALARELEDGQDVEVRYIRDGESRSVTLEAAEDEGLWSRFDSDDLPRGMVLRIDPEEGHRWTYRKPEGRIRLRGLDEWEGLGEMDIQIPEIHMDELRSEWFPENREIQVFPGGKGFFFGGGAQYSHGLSLRELNPELGEYFSTDRGVLVLASDEDSELGLVPGDVILAIDGRNVDDGMDVIRILGSYEEGEDITFRIMRHGQETGVEGTVTG